MKQIIILLLALVLIGGGYFIYKNTNPASYEANPTKQTTTPKTEEPIPTEPDNGIGDGAVPLPEMKEVESLGSSVNGRDINAYHFGTGDKEIIFIGGIHGGYSWNTAEVAYEAMDYLKSEATIPDNVMVTVIPVLNPDGLIKVTGTDGKFSAADVTGSASEQEAARFNANDVDLNRNFDCKWQTSGTWQNKTVSGGSKPFSEPESQAIKNYIEGHKPVAVITWYSAAGGVFSSNCDNGVSPATKSLTNLYAKAAGYKAYETFNFYEITGDMVNWFASQNIPAISVLLTDHNNTEWTKNKAGIDAVLKSFAE